MALVLYLIFFTIAIPGRIAMHYRKTGDHGVRPVTSNSSAITKIAVTLFWLSFLCSFVLSVFDVFNQLHYEVSLGNLGVVCGFLICILGIVITVVSQYQMGRSWRIGVDESEKTELITTGSYARARNPIYLGVIVFGCGILILIPHPRMLITELISYFSIELIVRYVEEPYLVSLFGDRYEVYRKKTNRYIPFSKNYDSL